MLKKLLALAIGALVAAGMLLTGAATASAAPTLVVDALTVPANAQVGQNVSATAKVRTSSGSLRVQAITIAVRLAGKAYDFPGARENVTVGAGGYTFTSSPRSFAAGTYEASVAVLVNGRWANLNPAKRFTIAAPAPGKVLVDSLTLPTTAKADASVSASTRLRASSGSVVTQAITIAVRKNGQAFDFPGAANGVTVPAGGYTFTSKARTFQPGTYDAFVAVQINGQWTNYPAQKFTVSAATVEEQCPKSTSTNPMTFCQDFKNRGDANAGLAKPLWQTDPCWSGQNGTQPNCDGVTSEYRDDHAYQDGEYLILKADRAHAPNAKCPIKDDLARKCDAASARLTMLNWNAPPWGQARWSQEGGHFEIKAELPTGEGLWPAFWTHGDPSKAGDWPRTGEIDIFESLGKEPNSVHQVVHGGPGADIRDEQQRTAPVPNGIAKPHVYAIDWKPGPDGYIIWSIDNNPTRTMKAAENPGIWKALSQPQALILDFKINGSWPGSGTVPAGNFTKIVKVDYVKVLKNPTKAPTP